MNWATIEGKWDQFKGKAKTKWGAFAHDAEKQLDDLLAKLERKDTTKKDEPQGPPS